MNRGANSGTKLVSFFIFWVALATLSASAYSILSVLGIVPMSWLIFFYWLGTLVFLNLGLILSFWRSRDHFPISRQLAMILWGGVSIWYWSFAPLYFFLNINVDLLQLKWTVLEFLWEVPVVGLLFVWTCLLLFRPVRRFVERDMLPPDPLKLYRLVVDYPTAVGILIFIFTFGGYILGTVQNHFLTYPPFIEQMKVLLNGAIISLFLGGFFYLLLDIFLGDIRLRIEKKYALVNAARKRIHNKIFGLTLITALGSLALISLLVFKSFQITVREQVLAGIRQDISRISRELGSAEGDEAREEIIQSLRRGSRGRVMLFEPGERLPAVEFSDETRAAYETQSFGIVDDYRGDIKLVTFFEDLALRKKAVSVVYVSDFYGTVFQGLRFFLVGYALIIMFIIFIARLFSRLITRPIRLLSEAVKSAAKEPHFYFNNLSTGDEFENLSHAFSHFVHETRRSTTALKEERARLLSAINSLSLGFAFFDAKKNLIVENRAIEQVFGRAEGKPRLAVMAEKFGGGAGLFEAAERCLKTNAPVELKELELDGQFFNLTIEPVRAVAESAELLIGFGLLAENVTHAKILDKTRDEFFAVASHELRTPLTVIRGNMAMAKTMFSPELEKNRELKKMIDETHTASIGLIKMVNDFLNMASLEQQRMSFNKERFDMGELVASVVAELEPIARMKNLYLKFVNSEDRIPQALADRERAKQVIFNLISNAINYTDTGGVKVFVGVAQSSIQVSVIDTGQGISPEGQQKLFQKFQRSREEILVKDTTKGTGLGLYISRLLAKGMGGELALVRSAPGEGSAFSFTLPIAV